MRQVNFKEFQLTHRRGADRPIRFSAGGLGGTSRLGDLAVFFLHPVALRRALSLTGDYFYRSPYTRLSARGVEGLFPDDEVDQLIAALDDVRLRAVG